LILLSAIVSFYIVSKYGRHGSSGRRFIEEYDAPPSEIPPAVIGWFFSSRMVTTHHLIATILDLSRRGYFKIRHEKVGKNSLFSSEKDEFYIEKSDGDPSRLNSWEKKLHDFINSRILIGKDSFSKLFDYGSSSDKGQKWLLEWNREVAKDAKSRNWVRYQPKVILAQVGIQLLIFCFAILTLFWASVTALGITALIVSSVGFVLCFFLYPRTEEGQEVFEKWRSYYKNLKDGNISKESEHQAAHIVYAITFGISGKKFEALTAGLKLQEDNLTWLLLMPGVSFNPTAITGAVNSMNHSLSTSVSTSISTGSGAVSGSAGGGSGGSAG